MQPKSSKPPRPRRFAADNRGRANFFSMATEPKFTTQRCAIGGQGLPMQMSIDGLLVALLVVLAPDQEPGAEHALAGLPVAPQAQQQNGQAPDTAACRIFIDPDARRKCAIRLSRPAPAGAAEPTLSFPESVIWMVPAEPAMPYKFYSPPTR